MFDKLIYKLRQPKYCKHCGGKLVTDEKFDYSDQTGEPLVRYVGIRCEFYYACFEKHGYLFRWHEAVEQGVQRIGGTRANESSVEEPANR